MPDDSASGARPNPRSVVGRRHLIERLLIEGRITTQTALVTELRSRGYDVSQSSVSRDLREIGAQRSADGWFMVPEPAPGPERSAELARALAEWCVSHFAVGDLIVLRTHPGAAQHVAARIDAARLPSVAAAVAGDDTILLVAASPDSEPSPNAIAALSDLGL